MKSVAWYFIRKEDFIPKFLLLSHANIMPVLNVCMCFNFVHECYHSTTLISSFHQHHLLVYIVIGHP